MEKEEDDAASMEMGSSKENGDANIVIQENASECLTSTAIESQESHMAFPVLRNTGATNVTATRLEKTEIPDSDAVSDFSSPVKPSSSSVNQHITAASPPNIGMWDQSQHTESDVKTDKAVAEVVPVTAISSAEVSLDVPNSSPPLMEDFTSSPMTEFKQTTAISLAAAGMAQLNGPGFAIGDAARDKSIMSEDIPKSITLINLPQVLTSLPELELIRTDFAPGSTYDEGHTANIENSSIAATTDLGDRQAVNGREADKPTSSIGHGLEKPNPTPVELPNSDSQYFDEAWREIMGTQTLPDSDLTQDASQANKAKEGSNYHGPTSMVGKDGLIAEINSLQAPMQQEISSNGGLHLENKSYADQNTTGESSQKTSDASLITTQEQLPGVLFVTSQTTDNAKSAFGNGEEVKKVENLAPSDEEVDGVSIPDNFPRDTTVATDVESIIAFRATKDPESNNIHMGEAALLATGLNFSQTTMASEQNSPASMENLDIGHDIGQDTILNPTSIVEIHAEEEGDDITISSRPVALAKPGTTLPVQIEQIGHQSTHKISALDEDTAMTVQTGTEIFIAEKVNDRNSARASNSLTQAGTVTPPIAPKAQQKLEILDSDDEPMSDDPLLELQSHKVNNTEPSGDVTKSTPLFGEPTITIVPFGSEVRDKATTQNEDVEMTGQDEERQKLYSTQTSTITDHAQDLPNGISQENEEPQKRRKRVIPDSDNEDGDEDEENIEEESVLPPAHQEPAKTPLASSLENSQSSRIAITGSKHSLPKVTQTPSSSPTVDAALPPSQKKSVKAPNVTFKLPAMSKDMDKDSLSSSPFKPESSSSITPRVGDQALERSGSNDVVIAELKAMKIASLKARNAALIAEIANKRAKLEEVNKTLKKPAAETVKTHIKLLHDYNDVRDVGQGLIGMIADNRGVRIGELYDEFGVNIKD